MRNNIIAFTLLTILFVSCEKEEPEFPINFYSPIIHGYYQTDDFGNVGKLVGSYDLKLSDPRLMNIKLENPNDHWHIASYPNPFHNFTNLSIGGEGISKKIWIVPAKPEGELTCFLNSNCFLINYQPVFKLETEASRIQIDMSQYKYNYYRIFIKIDDILLWNNIVKQ